VVVNPLTDEAALLERLKAGDEAAFMAIVEAWGPGMLRLARAHVSSAAVAEEVVQEAWVGILKGLDRFEGRSSLKTWAFRIVSNTAKTRGKRESRTLPFSSVGSDDDEDRGATVDPDRFLGDGTEAPGAWQRPPERFPDQRLEDAETRDAALAAIAGLPPRQREIITLRDIEGFTSEEACNALDVSETNQRVLLHRARAKVRAALEEHFGAAEDDG
jgi:RNA polymerase sigma-70 factor (ECF subfamily)